MKGTSDVRFKILLAEGSRGRLALDLPLLAVGDKYARSVKLAKPATSKCAANVVLAIVLLDVL